MKTQIVAASAGTGKTYRLAEELQKELLGDDAVEPERVVAMTYTRAAAAELEARVRRALIEAGQPRLARRLGAARIGTIHAVCARIVSEHAFDLGLSPELETLDENRALHAIHEALEQEVAEDERSQLDELAAVMGGFEWQRAVKEIVDSARLNGLGADDLPRCADRSAADLAAALPAAMSAEALEQELLGLIDGVLASAAPKVTSAQEELVELHDIRRTLRRGERVPWTRWLRLGESPWTVLRRFGSEHVRHPQLARDLAAAVRLVFRIAARALSRYEDEKRRQGVFDFVDQETLVLELLKNPAARARIGESIGLILVDEFQDTSPLQLAILSELASVAERAFFVGDQKQAIFGFRGTDPVLMERVMEGLPTSTSSALDVSYRSRPGLVDLTTALFLPAFVAQGIPADRVRVRAALAVEPVTPAGGLGPFLERWRTSGDRRSAAQEIAAGVAELLEDESVYVREGGGVSLVRPRHVAVLVRTNDHAADVTAALMDLGVPAVRRRRGLCTTLEARAVMAGLALFLDGRDALAAAEIARLTRNVDEPDKWLEALVTAPAGEAFRHEPLVEAVVKAGVSHRDAGVAAAVDLVVEALRLRDVCAAWGDTPQRLANLGALRALATRFVRERSSMGAGATVAGLLTRLEELAALGPRDDDPDDEQGDVSGQDAVDVVTWHKAKGREWPVVVLAQLLHRRPPSAFGVHVESDVLAVDPKRPLDGRWVRYWPSPYDPWWNEGGLFEALAGHDVQRHLEGRGDREELRLLYVGWTRARDRLVLPGPVPDGGRGFDLWQGPRSILRHLVDAQGTPLLRELDDDGSGVGRARWAGIDVEARLRTAAPRARREPPQLVRSAYAPLVGRTWAPATLQPSALEETGVADEPVMLGAPIALRAFADMDTMARLGSAVHGFLAADRPSPGGSGEELPARFRMAEALLQRFEVRHLLAPDDVVTIADRLRATLDARFPGARHRREAPVTERLEGGTVVRGIIDLALETEQGFVVVDHKTYVTSDPRGLSATFAGQLRAYARALTAATGKPVLETLIHLPLSAALVSVR